MSPVVDLDVWTVDGMFGKAEDLNRCPKDAFKM